MRGIKRRLVSFATRFRAPLIVALTAFIVSYVDPLGIEEATGDRALSTIMRLSSTLFVGSGEVTVVLIDQAYLESQPNPSWPLSYGDQGVLLRQIANETPSAVFVDLIYKNPHRNAPALLTAATATRPDQRDHPADLLKPIQSRFKDVPFYFAALPRYGGARGEADEFDPASFSPGLDTQGKLDPALEKQLALVSWSGYGDYYPMRLGRAGAMRTPAYALYQDQCIARGLPCAQESRRYEVPMRVRWGAFVPRDVAHHIDADVCQYTDVRDEANYPGRGLRLRALAWQFVLALADRSNEATEVNSRLPCMSFAVLPASFLSDATGTRNEKLIREALHDNFVFVGADIPGIPDHTVSPVQGQVPGVMLHAMAMENLLSSDGSYLRATPEWFLILLKLVILCGVAIFAASRPLKEGGFVHAIFVVIGVCAWVGCAAFAFMHDNTARGMLFLIGGALVTWFAAAETGKVVFLFILISALALWMIELGWEPTNWIALAVAASFVQQIARHYRLPGASLQLDTSGGKQK
jgi:hypothetical protein